MFASLFSVLSGGNLRVAGRNGGGFQWKIFQTTFPSIILYTVSVEVFQWQHNDQPTMRTGEQRKLTGTRDIVFQLSIRTIEWHFATNWQQTHAVETSVEWDAWSKTYPICGRTQCEWNTRISSDMEFSRYFRSTVIIFLQCVLATETVQNRGWRWVRVRERIKNNNFDVSLLVLCFDATEIKYSKTFPVQIFFSFS